MSAISDVIRNRHSARGGFDPARQVAQGDMQQILESARWAPTPSNMQNFEILLVDDPQQLKRICAIPDDLSERYLREHFDQLRFGENALKAKRCGMLAADYPVTWASPEAWSPQSNIRTQLTHLGMSLDEIQTVILVMYDKTKRAPGSEHDLLGHMSLGCVMENMWLTAQALGIGMHMLTVFNDGMVAKALESILMMPERMSVAFVCSVGYPVSTPASYLRVRRKLGDFVHHNRFGTKDQHWNMADDNN